MKSILNTLDILLGHLTAGIMTFLLYLILGVIAVTYLVITPIAMFEYGSGINDLDIMEVGTLFLLCAVTWRFFSRGISQNWRYWQLVRRFAFVVAMNALIVAFILFALLITGLVIKGEVEVSDFYELDELTSFASNVIMIISIYAATPLSPFYKDAHDTTLSDPSSVEESASEACSDSDGTQHTGTGDFAEDLKNFKAPDTPWERA